MRDDRFPPHERSSWGLVGRREKARRNRPQGTADIASNFFARQTADKDIRREMLLSADAQHADGSSGAPVPPSYPWRVGVLFDQSLCQCPAQRSVAGRKGVTPGPEVATSMAGPRPLPARGPLQHFDDNGSIGRTLQRRQPLAAATGGIGSRTVEVDNTGFGKQRGQRDIGGNPAIVRNGAMGRQYRSDVPVGGDQQRRHCCG